MSFYLFIFIYLFIFPEIQDKACKESYELVIQSLAKEATWN